jgi:hypothetical protein
LHPATSILLECLIKGFSVSERVRHAEAWLVWGSDSCHPHTFFGEKDGGGAPIQVHQHVDVVPVGERCELHVWQRIHLPNGSNAMAQTTEKNSDAGPPLSARIQ